VVKFEAELKEAGIENPIIAPIILPDYSTEEVIAKRWTEGLQENE
jgi:succinate dehydrogenase / fumarate reductase flavoprotein subunit/L-aspartate oxidase